MRAVGVDGCRGGWVAVALRGGYFEAALLCSTFADVLDAFPEADAIGVDIPIGVSDESPRDADRAAREFLGPKASSVFPCPPRKALEAATYAEARACAPSLSAQSYALRTKILEVELWLDDQRILEVHPEVSFAEIARSPITWPKKTWNGQMERRRLLRTMGIVLPDELEGGTAPADDVLDAAVAGWSAHRYARDEAEPLPKGHSARVGAIWR